jgi:hypothetical protein
LALARRCAARAWADPDFKAAPLAYPAIALPQPPPLAKAIAHP